MEQPRYPFKWDKFEGTDALKKNEAEQAKAKAKEDWKPAGHFHLVFFLVILSSIVLGVIINAVYPGQISCMLQRYINYQAVC